MKKYRVETLPGLTATHSESFGWWITSAYGHEERLATEQENDEIMALWLSGKKLENGAGSLWVDLTVAN